MSTHNNNVAKFVITLNMLKPNVSLHHNQCLFWVFFFATWLFVFEKMKRNMKHCDLRDFGPLFKMKIIKLTTSKPRLFWKNAITHLWQLLFNRCNHNQMSPWWRRTQGLQSFLWSFSFSHRTFGMKSFAICY